MRWQLTSIKIWKYMTTSMSKKCYRNKNRMIANRKPFFIYAKLTWYPTFCYIPENAVTLYITREHTLHNLNYLSSMTSISPPALRSIHLLPSERPYVSVVWGKVMAPFIWRREYACLSQRRPGKWSLQSSWWITLFIEPHINSSGPFIIHNMIFFGLDHNFDVITILVLSICMLLKSCVNRKNIICLTDLQFRFFHFQK